MGKAGLGHGGEVVLYSINYELELMTGLLAPLLGEGRQVPSGRLDRGAQRAL